MHCLDVAPLPGEGGDALAEPAEIAPLKMTLMPDGHGPHVAMLNLVRNDFVPELSQSLPEKMRSGQLIVNLRAEADPERLAVRVGHERAHEVEAEGAQHRRPVCPPQPADATSDTYQSSG
jgi:hypothetical protein